MSDIVLDLNYPGGAGDLIDTVVLASPVIARSWCIKFAILSCCPRRLRIGALMAFADSRTLGIGSDVNHYATGSTSGSMGSGGKDVTLLQIYQETAGCSGQPFSLKMCVTLSDFFSAGSNACVCAQTCGSSISYVDVSN